jgi:hypothetical protein
MAASSQTTIEGDMIILYLLVGTLCVAFINRTNLFGNADGYAYAPQPDVDR